MMHKLKKIDHKASKGHSNAMYRVRHGVNVQSWIPTLMCKQLEHKWGDLNWQDQAKTNANNRNSSDGSLHAGGSIPTYEHFKRLVSNNYIYFYISREEYYILHLFSYFIFNKNMQI